MSQGVRAIFEPLRSLGFASITASYVAIGTPLANQARIFKIDNKNTEFGRVKIQRCDRHKITCYRISGKELRLSHRREMTLFGRLVTYLKKALMASLRALMFSKNSLWVTTRRNHLNKRSIGLHLREVYLGRYSNCILPSSATNCSTM